MTLPSALIHATGNRRLLVLWGNLPFPLEAHSPANRVLALNRLSEPPSAPESARGLPALPPLPILSLDASQQLERAFAEAGIALQVVRTQQDVPVRNRHSLLKLAGDLATRSSVVLSRTEVRELRSRPDKRHILKEANRGAAQDGGAVLLLGCDPADEDFCAWWAVLAPVFHGAAWYAVGEPSAPWPEGIVCLDMDPSAVRDALWSAQPSPKKKAVPVQHRPALTGTAHQLPFDRLSPRDFERLCLWLVEEEGYIDAEHYGAAGSEQGRDLVAWRDGVQWAFQCKRVQSFGPSDAVKEVNKVLGLPQAERPSGLIFLVTCDVSATSRKRARERWGDEISCKFWTGTELDRRVKRHDDIVAEFFAAGASTGREPR